MKNVNSALALIEKWEGYQSEESWQRFNGSAWICLRDVNLVAESCSGETGLELARRGLAVIAKCLLPEFPVARIHWTVAKRRNLGAWKELQEFFQFREMLLNKVLELELELGHTVPFK